jgi:DNA-binding transcriptional regulator YhcF (GntR family)
LELARAAARQLGEEGKARTPLRLAPWAGTENAAPNASAQGAGRSTQTRIRSIGKLTAADLLMDDLDRNSDVPLHTQLYAGLRDSILDGRLRQGASMPSTRDLPALLGVSRNTVLEAYSQLQGEGFLEPRVGSGTYVASTIPDLMMKKPEDSPQPVSSPTISRPRTAAPVDPRATDGFRSPGSKSVLASPGGLLPRPPSIRVTSPGHLAQAK